MPVAEAREPVFRLCHAADRRCSAEVYERRKQIQRDRQAEVKAKLEAKGLMHIPKEALFIVCLLYTSPSPRDLSTSRMPSSA